MIVRFHKNFEKQYRKLNEKEQNKLKERIKIFLDNPFDFRLNNHALRGKYLDYRSINIAGDLRAIYKFVNENDAIFVAIGTHGELYS
jgi:addiction module RelE/StbE family toxin